MRATLVLLSAATPSLLYKGHGLQSQCWVKVWVDSAARSRRRAAGVWSVDVSAVQIDAAFVRLIDLGAVRLAVGETVILLTSPLHPYRNTC